ncbi:TIR domain-containing protein [Echinicola strongylocentroti]|nr:nucleotide-binding protein [Echinicola strongylocentroti]
MKDVISRYKIVYDDLDNLGLGNYLTSRDFKLSMSQKGLFDFWDNIVNIAADKRTFFAVGHDHEYFDSLTAFADLLNAISSEKKWEKVATFIVYSFIKSFKYKKNLKHLEESLSLSWFDEEELSQILLEINLNSEKVEELKQTKNFVHLNNGKMSKSKIFIVHGHEEGIKQSVARFLEKFDLNPVIINELPSESNTIIEQIEKYGDVDYAIVLMTGDDEGRRKGTDTLQERARQNVILELGYFLGKLGRKHVSVIYEKGVEIPSDFSGIIYIPYDYNEAWKVRLVKELKANGFEIDMNNYF